MDSITSSIIKLNKDDLIKATIKKSPEDLSCNICGKNFVNFGAKNMHLTKSHNITKTEADKRLQNRKINEKKCPNVYECSDCPKKFQSMKLVIQHFQKVHCERNFQCDKCLKRYALERDLKYHLSSKKCSGKPKVVNPNSLIKKKRIRKPKKKISSKKADLTKPGMRSIETQTEMMTLGLMSDACSQVCHYVEVEQPQQTQFIDQQQQTQFDEMYYPMSNDYQPFSFVNRDTQTYCLTNSVGTATPIWNSSSGYEIVDNGTQTWFPTNEEYLYSHRTVENYSMTEEHDFNH